MAEYQRGSGPNALPQGGASQVNAATPPPDLENTDIPVEYDTSPEGVPAKLGGLDEDSQVLTEPPYDGFKVPPKDRQGRLPTYVVRHSGQLQAAARDPSAHPTLRAYYRRMARDMEIEQLKGDR